MRDDSTDTIRLTELFFARDGGGAAGDGAAV